MAKPQISYPLGGAWKFVGQFAFGGLQVPFWGYFRDMGAACSSTCPLRRREKRAEATEEAGRCQTLPLPVWLCSFVFFVCRTAVLVLSKILVCGLHWWLGELKPWFLWRMKKTTP